MVPKMKSFSMKVCKQTKAYYVVLFVAALIFADRTQRRALRVESSAKYVANPYMRSSEESMILKAYRGVANTQSITSKLANRAEGKTEWCNDILAELNELPYRVHRKQWEYCFISRALDNFDKLKEGSKGIGFAVGLEPLAAYFVKRGANIIVSDLPVEDAESKNWAVTNQHSSMLKDTFRNGIVDLSIFESKAKFIPIDMNKIPANLINGDFDFTWSSSSLEHIGSVDLGRAFIINSIKALKVGGIAVHVTELCVSSTEDAGKFGHMSVWLKKDVDILAEELKQNGAKLFPVEYVIDNLDVDHEPYSNSEHFNLQAGKIIHTSVGLIIQRVN